MKSGVLCSNPAQIIKLKVTIQASFLVWMGNLVALYKHESVINASINKTVIAVCVCLSDLAQFYCHKLSSKCRSVSSWCGLIEFQKILARFNSDSDFTLIIFVQFNSDSTEFRFQFRFQPYYFRRIPELFQVLLVILAFNSIPFPPSLKTLEMWLQFQFRNRTSLVRNSLHAKFSWFLFIFRVLFDSGGFILKLGTSVFLTVTFVIPIIVVFNPWICIEMTFLHRGM